MPILPPPNYAKLVESRARLEHERVEESRRATTAELAKIDAQLCMLEAYAQTRCRACFEPLDGARLADAICSACARRAAVAS